MFFFFTSKVCARPSSFTTNPSADHESPQGRSKGHYIQLDHVAEDDRDDGKSIVSA
jgi:hypothetical protein